MSTELSHLTYEHEIAVTDAGVVRYNATVSFAPLDGDLPPGVTGVFVKEAVDPADPKTDVFRRVASVSDLFRAATTRDISLNPAAYMPAARDYMTSPGGLTANLYLASTITLSYDSLETIIEVKAILEQRVDQLIRDWRKYRDVYFAKTYTVLPLEENSVVAAAKSDYYAAADDLTRAEAAVVAADAAIAAADAAKAAAEQALSDLATYQSVVCPAVTQLTSFNVSRGAYFSAMGKGRPNLLQTLLNAKATADANQDYLDDALTLVTSARDTTGLGGDVKTLLIDAVSLLENLAEDEVSAVIDSAVRDEAPPYLALDTQAGSFESALSNLTTLCTTLGTSVTAARENVALAITGVALANSQKTKADEARQAAADAKDAAYREVIRVCRSFTPDV